MTKRSKPFRHNVLRRDLVPGELRIDWSKYGRVLPRRMPDVLINYQQRDGRIFCVAEFPVEQHECAARQIARQAAFWRDEVDNDA
ncbi:hypothetical protein [Paraburkholderia tropica]|uniref:hypothetical protein n=1 Tax=Paraburkholderia tropica TaxID=92647 RepID=UPI003D289A68